MSIQKYQTTPVLIGKGLKHIYWEIQQLLESTTVKTTSESLKYRFFILESSLIHVRVLLDFFEKKERSKRNNIEQDDILCSDFGFAPNRVNIPSDIRNRLNKDLAHLTYSRIEQTEETGKWPIFECHIPILDRSTQFIKHLVNKLRLNNSSEAVPQWEELNNRILKFISNINYI